MLTPVRFARTGAVSILSLISGKYLLPMTLLECTIGFFKAYEY